MRRLIVLVLALATLLGLLAAPALAQGAPDGLTAPEKPDWWFRPPTKAIVNVVHGIPGDSLGLPQELPVDVCLADGTPLITDFEFADVRRTRVPAGSYDVEVRLDDAADCGGATVLAAPGLGVEAGESYSVVANLTADGAPGFGSTLGLPIGLSVFVDDRSLSSWWQGRVSVRHTADAPAVDIWVKERRGSYGPAFIGLENVAGAQEGNADLTVGRYVAGIAISPSASPDDIAIERRFRVRFFRGLNLYAIGSLEDGNFRIVGQYQWLRP